MFMLTSLLSVAVLGLGANQTDVRALFETGNWKAVAQAADSGDPAVLFLKALSYTKLGQADAAAQTFGQIAAGRGGDDAWRFVGESGRLLAAGQAGPALNAATRAVELEGNLSQAPLSAGVGVRASPELRRRGRGVRPGGPDRPQLRVRALPRRDLLLPDPAHRSDGLALRAVPPTCAGRARAGRGRVDHAHRPRAVR